MRFLIGFIFFIGFEFCLPAIRHAMRFLNLWDSNYVQGRYRKTPLIRYEKSIGFKFNYAQGRCRKTPLLRYEKSIGFKFCSGEV
jgi:hypothetical protein